MLEQKDRELREAETREKLVVALEARGVDVDSFSEMIRRIKKGFDKAGLSSDIQRDIVVKMLAFELERPPQREGKLTHYLSFEPEPRALSFEPRAPSPEPLVICRTA